MSAMEAMCRRIFLAATMEERCEELFNALIEGGSATVDRGTGRLVVINGEQVLSIGEEPESERAGN